MPIRLTVHTTLPSRNGSSGTIWFVLEADFNTMADLHEALSEDGSIYGQRVYTRNLESGKKVVTHRTPVIVGLATVATIAPCHVDYEDEAGDE